MSAGELIHFLLAGLILCPKSRSQTAVSIAALAESPVDYLTIESNALCHQSLADGKAATRCDATASSTIIVAETLRQLLSIFNVSAQLSGSQRASLR
jgi:hypothetical protein